MKKYLFIFLLVFASHLEATVLTPEQKEIKEVAGKVANKYCLEDMCFTKTLQAIAWQESSFGVNLIGDQAKSLGPFQMQIATARRVIRTFDIKLYRGFTNDEISWLLLNNIKFSATLAVHYLKLNYLHAKKSGLKNPYRYAVSKYNGGDNNTVYINKILDKMEKL